MVMMVNPGNFRPKKKKSPSTLSVMQDSQRKVDNNQRINNNRKKITAGPRGLGPAIQPRKKKSTTVMGPRGPKTFDPPKKRTSTRRTEPTRNTPKSVRTSEPVPQKRTEAPKVGTGTGTVTPETSDNFKIQQVAPDPVEAPKAPEPMSLDEWYMQDSAYLSAEAAAKAARDQALAGYGRDRDSTNRGFGDSLRNLGRRWEDQNNNGYADDDELSASTWDSSNPLGAYGQAYKNTQDDFTGRGLMDSSFFVNAMTELDSSFDSQYGDMNTARQEALAELLAGEEGANSEYNAAIAAERANSAQRRALKYEL